MREAAVAGNLGHPGGSSGAFDSGPKFDHKCNQGFRILRAS